MFSKNTEKLESFIGSTAQFKGEIKSKGTLRIDGTVEGNIEADHLIIGEKANIRGNVNARNIVVGGVVEGNLNAKETIEIKHNGQVKGDIITGKLTVIEGGIINGRTLMQASETKVVELKEVKEKLS